MPAEAKPYGYNMNWKIFCYKYKGADMEFPVVSYLVTDVQQPASLPEDFEQNVAETTADSVTLTWTYDKFVSGFQLYRYYEFPDGSGSYRLEYVPFSKGVKNGDKYEFTYTDKGLSPYTEYKYQIQTESTYNPKVSIYSEPISCRTKTTVGYPQMTVSGLVKDGKDKGKLAIYPDAEGKAVVTVAEETKYKSLSYQWQKLVGGEWKNMPAFKTNELTIANASAADKGTYRCRVNAIYFDTTSQKEFPISAYTDAFETVYTKRTPEVVLTAKAEKYGNNKDINGIHAEVEIHSANYNNTTAPTGNVTITIEGKDYENTRVVALTPSTDTKSFNMGNNVFENKYYSKASLDVQGLAEGTYTVKYYYSGDSVFKDKTQEIGQIVAVGSANGYVLNMKNAAGQTVTKFTYGDTIDPILYTVAAGTSDTTEVTDPVTYKYKTSQKAALQAFTNGQKLDAGKYTMYAYTLNGSDAEPVASAAFTVEKKALIVSAIPRDNVTDVTTQAPELKTNVEGVEADSLDVEYKAYNSAGNKVTLSNDEPGNYTITPCFKEFETAAETAASEAKRANYDVSFESAIYTVIGQTYELNVSAEKYTDTNNVSKDVGTAAISENGLTTGKYTKGTTVQLFATPDEGYEVEKWVVNAEGYKEATYTADEMKANSQNPNRLNLSMNPGKTEVKVYFKVKKTRLNLIGTDGGDISCTDKNFESGAIVSRGADLEFKATPKAGYTFGQWIISETGFNSVYKKGTVAEDGTSTIVITMGTNDIGLRATFVRDSYRVELNGNVTAYYEKESNDGTSREKIYITSGAEVKGDTEIHVAPKIGYVAAENAFITINGEPTDQNASYSFSLTEDTTISLDTVRESYKVEASAETATAGTAGGKVVITADGTEVETGNNVDGGSRVVFKAIADRGCVFDHWEIGNETNDTADEYVIGEIGAAITVKAVFKENTKNTLTGVVSPENRGKLVYTLYDIYGNVLEENKDYENAIEMYKGESIDIKAAPASGSMVEQWIMKEGADEKKFVSASKNYPGGKITMNDSALEIQAVMVSSTSYELFFNAADANDGTMTATSDGTAIKTGDIIPGGADVVFTVEPADGKMVDYWTITKGAASVQPTEENTIKVTDSDGDIMVDPVYRVDGYKGNQTVRVYFKDVEQKNISVTGSNASVEFTYVTPIKKEDSTNPAGSSVEARTGGTVKLTLTPKSNYATSLSEVEVAFGGCSQTVKVDYKDGVYAIVLKGITEGKVVDVNSLVNKLVKVEASGKNYTASAIQTNKVADGAADGLVREGSNVSFKLTPDSGYQPDEAKLNAWVAEVKTKGTCDDLSVKINSDKSVDVEIKGIKEDVATAEELFKAIPFSGGGGVAPVAPEQKPTEDKNKITVEETVNGEGQKIVKITAKADAVKSKDEKSVELQLSAEQKEALMKRAIEEKADIIIIKNDKLDAEMEKISDSMNVKLDADLVKNIINKVNAEIAIETPVGNLKLDKKALEAIRKQIGDADQLTFKLNVEEVSDYSKIIGDTGYVISLELLAGKKKIKDFGDGKAEIKLEITNNLLGRELVALYIGEKGKIEKFDGKTVIEKFTDENGKESEVKYFTFETSHFSVYALAEKAKVAAYEKAQKIKKTIAGVKKTSVKLTTKSLKNKIKVSWSKSKGYKVDAYEVYRAASKNGKYSKLYTTKKSNAKGYTNSKKLNRGKTYFYKVRGVRTIDGKAYYTKWSNVAKEKLGKL